MANWVPIPYPVVGGGGVCAHDKLEHTPHEPLPVRLGWVSLEVVFSSL